MGKKQSKEKSKEPDTSHCSFGQTDTDVENKYQYVTDQFLGSVADNIGSEWIMVCVSLGVKRSHIDHILGDSSIQDMRAKIHRGLIRWRESSIDKTEESLIQQLHEALIDNSRRDLAEKIISEYKENIKRENKEETHSIRTNTTVKESEGQVVPSCTNTQAELSSTGKNYQYNDESKKEKAGNDEDLIDGKSKSTKPAVKTDTGEKSDVPFPVATSVKLAQKEDPDISMLRQKLYKINHAETERIPVSPLQKTSRLPLDDIYAPVFIREDLEYKGKGRNMGRERAGKSTKPVERPEDIFYIDGDLTRNAFMLGDAAHGKSVFCLRLVDDWCKAKNPSSGGAHFGLWQEVLQSFDFLFLVQLRHVDKSRASIIDMICHDVFQHYPSCRDTIRHVISSEYSDVLLS